MDSVLLVLGASSEIGSEYIKQSCDTYSIIIAHYNSNCENLLHLKSVLGDKLLLIQGDFSQPDEIEKFINEIYPYKSQITHILHCPAVKIVHERFTKYAWEEIQKDINIQVASIYKISQLLMAFMSKNKQGKIVFILSSNTITTPKFMLGYTIVKYTLLGFMKALAAEYADKNININAISPSMVETQFLSSIPEFVVQQNAASNPKKRNAQTTDITPLVNFLFSHNADYITGQNIVVNGGQII